MHFWLNSLIEKHRWHRRRQQSWSAVLLFGLSIPSSAWGGDSLLRLRDRTVLTGLTTIQPKAGGRSSFVGQFDEAKTYVVQLIGPMTPSYSNQFKAAGIRLGAYIPDHAYLWRGGAAEVTALRKMPMIRWVGPYENSWRLSKRIKLESPAAAPKIETSQPIRLLVSLFSGADSAQAGAALVNAGGRIESITFLDDGPLLAVSAQPSLISEFVRIPDVAFIEPAPVASTRNDQVAWVMQSDQPSSTPLWDKGLHGEGQMGGIIDTPFNASVCAFRDTVPIGPEHRKIHAYRGVPGASRHGTHVAGTFLGDAFPTTRSQYRSGMAYAARLSFSSLADINANPASLQDRLTDAHLDGARVHNNSWGEENSADYTIWSRQVDLFSREFEESLVCFAISNAATLKSPENAKNCLSVGATLGPPGESIIYEGGRGPTSDGRMKPDLFAPGSGVWSANHLVDCGFLSSSGTSMACPAVAGMALLVRQYFTDGYYPGGSADPACAVVPTGALLKATLINAAVDLTGEAGYPTNREGWGRPILDDGLYFAGDSRGLRIRDVRNASGLATDERSGLVISVTDEDEPLRVTLVWTDVAAAVGAAGNLINDLDLKVTSPNGDVFWGNALDTSAGKSRAAGEPDRVNNVEQVIVPVPEFGQYRLEIQAHAVNAPADAPRQGFALVVTGAIEGATGPQEDCNANGIPDIDEIVSDCNQNGIPDSCDIRHGISSDCGSNGIPDECEPRFSADAGPDQAICVGGEGLRLGGMGEVVTGGAAPFRFAWRILSGPANQGILAASEERSTFRPVAPGTYEIELQVTDASSSGCTVRDTVTVVAGLAQADAGPDQTGLPGQPIPLGSPATGICDPGPCGFTWRIASAELVEATLEDASGPMPTLTASTPGDYELRLSVAGPQGCIAQDEMMITIAPQSQPAPAPLGSLPCGLCGGGVGGVSSLLTLGWAWSRRRKAVSSRRN